MYPGGNGNNCSIQFKVRVLTSQQQCYFIIRIRLFDNNGHVVETFSQPIKSCSKLDQIRRKEAEKQGQKVAPPKKKRTRGEELIEILDDIRTTQREHSQLLQHLLRSYSSPVNTHPSVDKSVSYFPDSLETAVQSVLMAYDRTQENERPNKIRRLKESLSPSNQNVLQELGKYFLEESKEEEIIIESPKQSCSTNVEVKIESSGNLDSDSVREECEYTSTPYSDVFEFFSNTGVNSSCPQKDLDLWNDTLNYFLIYDDTVL